MAGTSVAAFLVTTHKALARIAKCPELALEHDEAMDIARAYVEARKHFKVPVIDPKWVALGNLALAVGTVYQPKLMAIAERGRGQAPLVVPAPMQAAPEQHAATRDPGDEWLSPAIN